jgi:signal transduction histidine kinase
LLSPQRTILLCFLFASLFLSAKDNPSVTIKSGERQAIGKQVDYFLDNTRSLTLKDIVHDPSNFSFTTSREETLNFGPTSSVCWIRFSYSSTDSLADYLEIGNTNLNEIDFAVLDGDSLISEVKTGLGRRNATETFKLNGWLLELPPAINGKVYTVYLRISDKRRVIVPLQITHLRASIQEAHKTDFLFGLYFGCIGIIATLNIFFFIYFRERIYLFYSFHILTQIVINGILKGYLLSLFGKSVYFVSPYVSGLAGLSNITFILFSLTFLRVKDLFPRLYQYSIWLMLLPGLNLLLNLFGVFTLSAIAGTYIGMIVCVWLFGLGLYAYRNDVKQARFYLVGWGLFFIGIMILNFALNGWIAVNSFTYNAAVYGTLLEVLLISCAQADRINLVRMERHHERQQRIDLVEKQNLWLEENVKLRTLELSRKNSEIETQNEELKQQHEELVSTHEQLEKQKHLIEKKNQDIENINQSLEQKVTERTLELEATVKSLIRQNHDLEQFSFIVSHNMRAPVARILGLVDLMKLEGVADNEKEELVEYLKESTLGLDQIIHDLSQIIAIRKGLDMAMEKIDPEKILKHNLSDLTDEIKKAEAEIKSSVKVKEMVSVKGYIQSILYNLLSNAIKYRSPERRLQVDVSIYEAEGNTIFKVKDNGLGITLKKERLPEIFHLYKRIHTHVQGKGLGLYLVKTQVDGLHGKIEVDTAPDAGTTFTISIPNQ